MTLPACTFEPSSSSTTCQTISSSVSPESAISRSIRTVLVLISRARAIRRPIEAVEESWCDIRRIRTPWSDRRRCRASHRPIGRGPGQRRRTLLHQNVRGVRELDDLPPDDVIRGFVVHPQLQIGGGGQLHHDRIVVAPGVTATMGTCDQVTNAWLSDATAVIAVDGKRRVS